MGIAKWFKEFRKRLNRIGKICSWKSFKKICKGFRNGIKFLEILQRFYSERLGEKL